MDKITNRGDVWWVDFTSSIGGEIQKTRPAIIISNDFSNKTLNRVQVVPITSNTDKLYPCEAYIVVDAKGAKAMADQLTTVSKMRLSDKICQLNNEEIDKVIQAIKIQLNI